jgi:hypothetical protein
LPRFARNDSFCNIHNRSKRQLRILGSIKKVSNYFITKNFIFKKILLFVLPPYIILCIDLAFFTFSLVFSLFSRLFCVFCYFFVRFVVLYIIFINNSLILRGYFMGSMTFEQAMALFDKKIADDNAKREAADAKFYAVLEADKKKWGEKLKEAEEKERLRDRHWSQMFQTLGSLKRTMGELVELVIMPKVIKQINKYGHQFNIVAPNKHFYRENGQTMAEVDLILENCDEAFILEIKSNFRDGDIKEHVERMETLRKNDDISGMRGRLMYAGIAGVSISPHIRDLAHGHGMYVLTIREEEERIEVEPPEVKKMW